MDASPGTVQRGVNAMLKIIIVPTENGFVKLPQDEFAQLINDVGTPQWVPVADRLPEEEGEYITTLKDYMGKFVSSHAFDGKEFGFYMHDENNLNVTWNPVTNVIAWMPLPSPYKGGE